MKPKFGVYGGGYEGVAIAIGWAERGYSVVLIETSSARFRELIEGSFLSMEPELIETFRMMREHGNLEISQDLTHLSNVDFVLLCVSTSRKEDSQPEMLPLWTAVEQVTTYLPNHVGLIIKSTVPVGTADQIQNWFKQKNQCVEVIVSPEFLSQGKTMEDIRNPPRIILGGDIDHPKMTLLRRLLAKHHAPILVTTRKNAEMIKYAANAFLATKISFINEIAQLCEALGLDVETIARGIGMDPRIGQAFLKAGHGLGEPCLSNDLSSLIYQAQQYQNEVLLLDTVRKVNQQQEEWVLNKLTDILDNTSGKRIAVWVDTNYSISLPLMEKIQTQGVQIQVYDPLNIKAEKMVPFPGRVYVDPLVATEQADALLILTDWQKLKEIDLLEVKKRLRLPNIIDARNLYPPAMMRELGFKYVSVGRKV